METCKVCGKEFKKVNIMHMRTHDLDQEQYDMLPEFKQNVEPIEPKGNTKVSIDERDKKIWGDRVKDINRPLSDFLGEFGLTEKEARGILKNYTTGKKVDPVIEAKNFKRIGDEGAKEHLHKTYVEVTNLHVAEVLSTEYGFTCTNVIGARGDKPKTWVLEKL